MKTLTILLLAMCAGAQAQTGDLPRFMARYAGPPIFTGSIDRVETDWKAAKQLREIGYLSASLGEVIDAIAVLNERVNTLLDANRITVVNTVTAACERAHCVNTVVTGSMTITSERFLVGAEALDYLMRTNSTAEAETPASAEGVE